jgi:spore coat polysaccharide biosynthesis protein SpsF (cytidylyltransferase family)
MLLAAIRHPILFAYLWLSWRKYTRELRYSLAVRCADDFALYLVLWAVFKRTFKQYLADVLREANRNAANPA